jgi:hypothetical protein
LCRLEGIVQRIRDYDGKVCWIRDLQYVIHYLDMRIAGQFIGTEWAVEAIKHPLIRRWYQMSMDLSI